MGIIVASAFLIGAAVAVIRRFPRRIKGNLAAIAAGIYFSTLAFSVVEEGIKVSSFSAVVIGFAIGAFSFSLAHPIVKERKELKRILSPSRFKGSNNKIAKTGSAKKYNQKDPSSGEMNIVGTVLDSIPENLFIRAIIALNLSGLTAALIALFLGNLAATVDGAQRMFSEGMTRSRIFKKWFVDFAIVAPAGLVGWYLVKPLDEGVGVIIGFAAGALLVFVTVDLIPKAYSEIRWHIGLSTTLGLLVVLAIFHYLG